MTRSLACCGLTAFVLSLSACAAYAPRPLAASPAAHDFTALARDAATIDRPFLHPAAIDLARPLDENAVAVLAVLGNPDLKAQRLKIGVADAQIFAARLLPDPTFSIGGGALLAGPDPAAEIAGALGLDLKALREGKVMRQQADAQARQVRLDLAWAEWQTAGQARIQAARIRRLDAALVILRQDLAAAGSLLNRTLRAAARGDVAADSVQSARADLRTTQDKLVTAEHDLLAARQELAKLLGLAPGTLLQLAPGTDDDRVLDTAHLTDVATAGRADLAALRAGYDAQEAAVHKAVLDQFPTLALNVTATRDTSRNFILGPTIDFTLPLWNRNRGGIAIERATRESLRAEYDARLSQTQAEIAAAVNTIGLARRQRDAIRVDLPSLEQVASASQRGAARGDLSDATADAASGALRDQRVALLSAEQTIDEAMIALELLTGIPKEDWQ